MTVQEQHIPLGLRALPKWVAWQYREHDGSQKKVPICCLTGRAASVSDPATWTTFSVAFDYFERQGLDGVGFVFGGDDEIMGVDLDNCRDPKTGVIEQGAKDVVASLNSYTEVSPSGTGLKVFLRGVLPGNRHRTQNIEMYGPGRFFTVTGEHLPSTPKSIEQRQDAINKLYADTFELDDQQVILKASRAKKGDKFQRLMAGDWAGYKSESEADLALCSLLAYSTNYNRSQTERIFGGSPLGQRDKWWERPDYRQATLAKAFQKLAATPSSSLVGRDLPAPPRDKDAVLSFEQLGQAERIADHLAQAVGDVETDELMFVLARRLLAVAREVPDSVFEPVIVTFAEKSGKDPEDCLESFSRCWRTVMLAEGEDPVEWAVNMARKYPYMKPPTPRRQRYAMIAGVALHLARFRKDKPFWFAAERLAALLGTCQKSIYNTLANLKEGGIIKQESGYKPRVLSTEYSFAGPFPHPSMPTYNQDSQVISG